MPSYAMQSLLIGKDVEKALEELKEARAALDRAASHFESAQHAYAAARSRDLRDQASNLLTNVVLPGRNS